MKKMLIITSCIFLIGLSTLGYTLKPSKGQTQYKGMELEINDLPQYGVVIHGPASAGFAGRLTALTSIPAELSENALKYSVVLENKTPQNINALYVSWRFYPSEGAPLERAASCNLISSPVFNDTEGRLVGANQQYTLSLLAQGLGMAGEGVLREMKNDDQTQKNLNAVKSLIARSVRWSFNIDAVMFSNGVMVGPNENGYLDVLTSRINGARDLIREVSEKFNRSEDAWAHAASYAATTEEKIEAQFPDFRARIKNHEFAYKIAKHSAAQTIVTQKKNLGEKNALDWITKMSSRQIPLTRK